MVPLRFHADPMEDSMLALLIAAQVTMATVPDDHQTNAHQVTLGMYDDAFGVCVYGLDHEGTEVTDDAARDRACNTARVLFVLLTEQGYCYIREENRWAAECG
jgi:hypothetical protein